MITYTFEAVRASKKITRVVVSTDDDDLVGLASAAGLDVPFRRPANLSTDETPMLDVIRHALSELPSYSPDLIVLLQPTSPLRSADDIDRAVQLSVESGASTVVTIVAIPHQFHPRSALEMSNGVLTPFIEGPLILQRQSKSPVYARNGPAVLVIRKEVIESGRLYGDVVRGMEMSASASVDIDGPEDLLIAEFWLRQRHRS